MPQNVEDTHETPASSPAEETAEDLQAELTTIQGRETQIQDSPTRHQTAFIGMMNSEDDDDGAIFNAMVEKSYLIDQLQMALEVQAKRKKGLQEKLQKMGVTTD
jgi:hypothetical protein